jgi:UDP-glucose 4-epimerase
MKTVLVTGGAGFIGSRLARRLLENNDRVYVLDDLSTGFERNILPGSVFLRCDISDVSQLEKLDMPESFDTVFHLAAQSSGEASFDEPARDIDVNYKGTLNILRLAAKKKCRRFIFSSSMSVYGEVDPDRPQVSEDHPCRPASYYGCNKLASEKLMDVFCQDGRMKPTIFRLFNVYGPGQNMLNLRQGMVSIYFSYLMNGTPVHVKGSLERFRDFIYVDDVVDMLTAADENERTFHRIFNLGTGNKTTVRDLLAAMLRVYGRTDFKAWARVDGATPGDIAGCIADTARLYQATEWKPRWSLQDGLGRMKEWIDETADWWKTGQA